MNLTSIAPRLSLSILVCSAVLASASTATAQDAVFTEIVGYKTETIRGDGALSYIGINLLANPIYDGSVTAAVENTLHVSGVDFSELLDPTGHYFVDIIAADNESAVGHNTGILHWSDSTLTLADDLSDLLADGTVRIRIHRLPTIGEIFGQGGDVLSGGTLNNADMIYLPNPNGSEVIALYYSQSPMFGTGWRQVGEVGDKSDTPIYFTDGLYIHKRSPGNASLEFSGLVKTTRAVVVVEEGFVPYSSVFPGGSTLGNSGLYNPETPQQSLRAGTATAADSILMDTDGDGEPEMYYYSSSPMFGIGWRKVGEVGDKSDTPLTSAFVIINRNGTTSIVLDPAY